MRGFDLAAQPVDVDQPGCLVDAQDLAHLGRTVPEDGEEGSHLLAQQTQHQCFGKGEIQAAGKAGMARQQGRMLHPLAGQVRRDQVWYFDPFSPLDYIHD